MSYESKITIEMGVGVNRRPPTKKDINASIEAVTRVINGENLRVVDQHQFIYIKSILEGIKSKLPNIS